MTRNHIDAGKAANTSDSEVYDFASKRLEPGAEPYFGHAIGTMLFQYMQ